ncbi:MAG: hypothetical protein ABIC95_02865 [archaeon]
MEALPFVNISLPLYVVIPLIFAYLVWSKFLNQSKLRPKNVEDLFDIFTIFAIFFTLLFGSLVIMTMFFHILNYPFTNTNLGDLTSVIIMLTIVFLVATIMWTRHLHPSKKHLIESITAVFQILIGMLCYFIALQLYLLFTPLNQALSEFHIVIIFMIILIFPVYLTSLFSFKGPSLKQIFTKGAIFIFSGILIFTLATSYFSLPNYQFSDPREVEYTFSDVDLHRGGTAYLEKEVILTVNSFGRWSSLSSFIPFYYGDYKFITNNNRKELSVDFNTSNGDRKTLSGSFENLLKLDSDSSPLIDRVIHNEDEQMVVIAYNRKEMLAAEVSHFIFRGFSHVNISEDEYSYDDSSDEGKNCADHKCEYRLTIKSSLATAIDVEDNTLDNLRYEDVNSTLCIFSGIEIDTSRMSDTHRRSIDCKRQGCSFEITNNRTNKEVLDAGFYIDGDIVRIHYLSIYHPVDINMSLKMSCNGSTDS